MEKSNIIEFDWARYNSNPNCYRIKTTNGNDVRINDVFQLDKGFDYDYLIGLVETETCFIPKTWTFTGIDVDMCKGYNLVMEVVESQEDAQEENVDLDRINHLHDIFSESKSMNDYEIRTLNDAISILRKYGVNTSAISNVVSCLKKSNNGIESVIDKLSDDIKRLAENCEHEWVMVYSDSHHNYYVCNKCGTTMKE